MRGVVAQKICGLTHLGHCVGGGLAGFAHQQGHQRLHPGLVAVGCGLQHAGAQGGGGVVPGGLGLVGRLQRLLNLLGRGICHMAQHLLQLGGVGDGAACLARCGNGWWPGLRETVRQRSQHTFIAQIQTL